jgi:nucleoside-diphosphate kinase
VEERTLMLIKPDATGRGQIGRILERVERAGFRLVRLKLVRLTPAEARRFYRVHAGRPFLEDLVAFISSGPVCAVVLEREGAIAELRRLVGATDPRAAAAGSLRREFGSDTRHNAVHASDAAETARAEIAFFGLTLEREAG